MLAHGFAGLVCCSHQEHSSRGTRLLKACFLYLVPVNGHSEVRVRNCSIKIRGTCYRNQSCRARTVGDTDHCKIPYLLSTDALVLKFAVFFNLVTIWAYKATVYYFLMSCLLLFHFSQLLEVIPIHHFSCLMQEFSLLHAILLAVKS